MLGGGLRGIVQGGLDCAHRGMRSRGLRIDIEGAIDGGPGIGPVAAEIQNIRRREVEPHRIAALAIERWLTTDPRARDLVRRFALHPQVKKENHGETFTL